MAALLSFAWPGLGQLYTGRRRLAAVFAIPTILVLLVLLYQLRQGIVVFGARLVNPHFALAAFAVVVLVGIWRLGSVAHAFLAGEPLKTTRVVERAAAIALAAVIVLSHGAAGYVLWVSYQAGSHAFDPNSPLVDQATPGPSLAAGETPSPTPLVTPVPAPQIDRRVTILFTGVDAGPGRTETLYDSLMVVSYDPKSNSVQMVSVPRDSASFPLYFGGKVAVTTRINSLPGYARNGWVKSPDAPFPTLVNEISYLVGIPINYYAVMNLDGFVTMIDMVGGIDVVNPSAIDDYTYATPVGQIIGFHLAAGPQHLNGDQALAYVRSRHGADNSDYARSSRQQQVLVDLLHKMAQPGEILALPSLISALGTNISTNFPPDSVADFVSVGLSIPKENFKQYVLGPPYSILNVNSVNTAATSCLLNYKVAALSIELFGTDSLWYGKPAPANTCP